jgi:CBS domain-containing protein
MDKTQVKDLMTKSEALITVNLEESIDKVAQLMVEKGVGSVIVFEGKKAIGVITKKDILSRVIINCHDPCDIKAKKIASTNLITISPEKTVKEALMLMYKHKIRRILVKTPDHDELDGIITTHDLIAAYNSLELPNSSLISESNH